MRRKCRERFPHHRLKRKPLISDLNMRHGTCVTHVPWCMSGSLTVGGGENVLSIPGTYATRNLTYLVRGPCGFCNSVESHCTEVQYYKSLQYFSGKGGEGITQKSGVFARSRYQGQRQILRDVNTCPCPTYLLLVQHSSNQTLTSHDTPHRYREVIYAVLQKPGHGKTWHDHSVSWKITIHNPSDSYMWR